MNLPLSGWHVPRVDISLLKVGKHELTWGSIVAVGAKEHVGEPQLGRDG